MNLLQLQEQNGKGHLFIISTTWGDIPFKLPSLRKAQQYIASLVLAQDEHTVLMIKEAIFRECVVDEVIAFEEADMPAGIVPSLADHILGLSGMTEDNVQYTEELFNSYREQDNIVSKMIRTICSIFSGYRFEDLRELDYQDCSKQR